MIIQAAVWALLIWFVLPIAAILTVLVIEEFRVRARHRKDW